MFTISKTAKAGHLRDGKNFIKIEKNALIILLGGECMLFYFIKKFFDTQRKIPEFQQAICLKQ